MDSGIKKFLNIWNCRKSVLSLVKIKIMYHKPNYLKEPDFTLWERIRDLWWGAIFPTRKWVERMNGYYERCYWAQVEWLQKQGHEVDLSHHGINPSNAK